MNSVLRKLKKHWITLWLVIVSVILGTFVTYAIYTEISTVKRVVTTKSAPKELFSSNCMYADLYERRIPAAEFNVNVNNFDLNSPEIPNPSEIQYTLTARLEVKYNGTIMTFEALGQLIGTGSDEYKEIVKRATEPWTESETSYGYFIGKSQDNNAAGIIVSPVMTQFTADNNFQVVFGSEPSYESLPRGVVSTDRFKVMIPEHDFNETDPEFYVYVQAISTDTGLTQLIRTRLYGSRNVIATAAWSGTLAEKNTATTDYDFYNYIISGSGSGKLDIMWQDDWFEIDDFFFNSSLSGVTFDESSLDGEDNVVIGTVSGGTYNGWKKVTIVVDSTNSKSRYEIQLYKNKSNTPYIGDDNAANHIHCELQ